MESIRIQNLRSLADTGFIDLKPITLLLGQNSSGKSTFLRSFPLFRQSIEARLKGPFLWYGPFVDFGSFEESLNKSHEKEEIVFSFRLKLTNDMGRRSSINQERAARILLSAQTVQVSIYILNDERRHQSYVKKCIVELGDAAEVDGVSNQPPSFDHKMILEFDLDGDLSSFTVNGVNYSNYVENYRVYYASGIVPVILEVNEGYLEENLSGKGIMTEILTRVRQQLPSNTSLDKVNTIVNQIRLGSSAAMLEQMKTITVTHGWEKLVAEWDQQTPEFIHLLSLIIALRTPFILEACNANLSSTAQNSHYIAPVRATAERYYRVQNLSVEEVDFQGRNLAMFLQNLAAREFEAFSKWSENNFGFTPVVKTSAGHISLNLRETGSSNEFNLADMGFGFSQILPILTQLWMLTNDRRFSMVSSNVRKSLAGRERQIIFAIEQPELHLHPRLQAKLVDTFVKAVSSPFPQARLHTKLNLIIETHSDTIVNRFGHRVANGDIDHNSINVVMFNKAPNESNTLIRIGKYDEEGYLVNWPIGFLEPDLVK